MMGAMPLLSHFGSVNRLQRLYFMGETGTIDIMRSNIVNKLNNAEDPVVLLNGNSDNVDYKSGFHEILVGSFLNRDVWCKGSSESDTQVHYMNLDHNIVPLGWTGALTQLIVENQLSYLLPHSITRIDYA